MHLSVCLLFFLCFGFIKAQEKITINWNSVIEQTSTLQFGTNDFLIDDSEIVQGGTYRDTLKQLNLGFFRFHNEGLADKWTSNITRTWIESEIKLQFDDYARAFGDEFPTIIMTVPKWPAWLCNESILDPSLYGEYTQLLTDLVRIINIDQGRKILYWEPFNEQDLNYRPVGKLSELYKLYSILSQAMTKVDPSIQVGGPAWSYSSQQETINFLNLGGPNISFLSWHTYIEGATSVPKSDTEILADTTEFVGLISGYISAARSVKPGIKLFMDEFNVFYDWRQGDPRIFKNMGAVWYASLHRIIAESGLTGATNWNARDNTFGFIDDDNNLRYPAYIFKWSNTYFVGNLVNATTTNSSLEVMAVYNKEGASVYIINKSMVDTLFVISQIGNLLGSGELLLNKVNATGPYEGLSVDSNLLSSGVTIEPESVWCLHKSS